MNNIKLFITDIDGVWTDGGMYYDETGNEWKKFNTADSAGVLFLRLLGIPTAIITGENTQIVQLIKKYKLDWNEIAYIGDDINDIQLLKKVGLSACPQNAPDYIKAEVDISLSKDGGEGAFRQFVENYLEQKKLLTKVIDLFLQNKSKLNQ